MPSTWKIAGSDAALLVETIGYENSRATNLSDANWLSCWVRLKIGSFRGNYAASFTTHDFGYFLEELEAMLTEKGDSAAFQTVEEMLRIEVRLRSNGTVLVEGVTQTHDLPRVKLSFKFESDQSYITQTVNELKSTVRNFPVKESLDL